jgi:hypothetical protein
MLSLTISGIKQQLAQADRRHPQRLCPIPAALREEVRTSGGLMITTQQNQDLTADELAAIATGQTAANDLRVRLQTELARVGGFSGGRR